MVSAIRCECPAGSVLQGHCVQGGAQVHAAALPLSPRENRASAQQKTLEARNTLQLWKKSYFDTRAKIEASGREARWEFDRKRLFERTDYMASICQDLCDILQVGLLFLQAPRTMGGGASLRERSRLCVWGKQSGRV